MIRVAAARDWGRIGIVISHRFSTVRIADRIAVVDGHRLALDGEPRVLRQAVIAARPRVARVARTIAALSGADLVAPETEVWIMQALSGG